MINLNTGKSKNYREEVGSININNRDKNDLKNFFYKYPIDSIKGKYLTKQNLLILTKI